MSQSLIRKNQLHSDIADLVGQYGSGYFISSGVFQASTSGIVYTTGNQTISGIKTFASRPTANGTGILLSGENIKVADIDSNGYIFASNGLSTYGEVYAQNGLNFGIDSAQLIFDTSGNISLRYIGPEFSGIVNFHPTGTTFFSPVKFRNNINVSSSGNFDSGLYIKNSPIYSYGTFYDTGNYAISSTTSSYLMQFGSTGIANGITIGSTGSTDRSKIIIRDSGIYNLQFSSQVSNSENNVTNEITIWLKKNGVDEPWTTSIVSIPGLHSSITGRSIPSWNFFVNANTGDYFQLAYQGNSTNLSFNSVTGLTSPTRPNIPANILTVNKVGY